MDRIVEQCAPEPMRAHCSTLVQCMAHLPGWGEKNFQVCVCVRVRVCVCEHVHVRAGGQAARAGAGLISMKQLLRGDAGEVFAEWKAKPDKVIY